MNADGARKTVLLEVLSGGPLYPSWSPDGRSVCFGISAILTNGTPCEGLAVLDVDVTSGTPVGRDFRVLVAGPFPFPAWSPDGDTIAYSYNGRIHSVPAAGGTPTVLYGTNVSGPIAWRPDGTRIAFGSGGASAATVNVLDVATGSTTQVCSITGPSGFIAGQLDWCRTSGNRIAFHVRESSGSGYYVYTVEATAGATPQLVASSAWFPTWSPNDSRIAYTTGTKDNIVVRNLQTGDVTATGGRGRMANWRRY